MQSKPITAIIVLSHVGASLLVTGCTTNNSTGSGTGNDYNPNKYGWSGVFTKEYSSNNIIVTPFYKQTAPDGNTRYIGVVRSFSSQTPNTVTIEFCQNEAQADQLYQSAVTSAINKGYVARATTPSGYTKAWQGDYGSSFQFAGYYQNPLGFPIGNNEFISDQSWLLLTEYA